LPRFQKSPEIHIKRSIFTSSFLPFSFISLPPSIEWEKRGKKREKRGKEEKRRWEKRGEKKRGKEGVKEGKRRSTRKTYLFKAICIFNYDNLMEDTNSRYVENIGFDSRNLPHNKWNKNRRKKGKEGEKRGKEGRRSKRKKIPV
jgi:hypothetical protein